MADKPVPSRRPRTTVKEDLAEIIKRGSSLSGGLFGDTARTLRSRGSQIDQAVDDAEIGARHRRQHTDDNN